MGRHSDSLTRAHIHSHTYTHTSERVHVAARFNAECYIFANDHQQQNCKYMSYVIVMHTVNVSVLSSHTLFFFQLIFSFFWLSGGFSHSTAQCCCVHTKTHTRMLTSTILLVLTTHTHTHKTSAHDECFCL